MSNYAASVRYTKPHSSSRSGLPNSSKSANSKQNSQKGEETENFELKMKIFYLEEKLAKLEEGGGELFSHMRREAMKFSNNIRFAPKLCSALGNKSKARGAHGATISKTP